MITSSLLVENGCQLYVIYNILLLVFVLFLEDVHLV